MTITFELILIGALIVCAISALHAKHLLSAVVIFMAYGLVMAVIWALLQSPDLAFTEAAVGAGVTGILLLITLKKIHALKNKKDDQ